ncbi:uncharacterized protein [Maniola hyperantus]|uniref:uncharacterized protein n=1 Tax=Aphantopus hyperantus TaxID=2795564 RepID=UPI0037479453
MEQRTRRGRKRKAQSPVQSENVVTENDINVNQPMPGRNVAGDVEVAPKRRRLVKAKPSSVRNKEFSMLYKLINRNTRMIEEKFKTLENRLAQEQQLTDNVTSVQLEPVENTASKIEDYATCNIMNIATEKPKFYNGKSHPVTFIEDLTAYLRKVPNKGKELELAYECLQGEAKDWVRLYKSRWKNLDDFKYDFLQTYWGETEQNKIRREIVCAKWNRSTQPTMLGHFLKLTSQVKMLSFEIPEKQLVSDMMKQYPKSIQQMWIITKGETIFEATEFLRKQDDINKQEDTGPIDKPRNGYAYKEETLQRDQNRQGNRNWRRPFNAINRQYNGQDEQCNAIQVGDINYGENLDEIQGCNTHQSN